MTWVAWTEPLAGIELDVFDAILSKNRQLFHCEAHNSGTALYDLLRCTGSYCSRGQAAGCLDQTGEVQIVYHYLHTAQFASAQGPVWLGLIWALCFKGTRSRWTAFLTRFRAQILLVVLSNFGRRSARFLRMCIRKICPRRETTESEYDLLVWHVEFCRIWCICKSRAFLIYLCYARIRKKTTLH